MRSRIPLTYAGLLIIALVAVVGFAAFSPSSGEPVADTTDTSEAAAAQPRASARVASAVLALRVSDAESRTATTNAADGTTTTAGVEELTVATQESEPTSTSEAETTTTEDSTTTSEAETTTTDAPVAATTAADSTPPALRINSPDDGATVTDRIVEFRGVTEPGASVTSGPFDADVEDDGTWSIDLVLSPGANGASITATDDAGNETTKRIVVYYEPPSTTTTTKPPTTTTTQPSATTTTSAGSQWSPLWPADAGGRRNVEAWRSLVAQYWPADLVDCALNIIDAESEGDPRAYNSRSGAEGLFQHLSKYWKGRAAAAGFRDADGLYATPYNAEANIAAAWLIAKGSNPWHRPWTVNPYYGACQE